MPGFTDDNRYTPTSGIEVAMLENIRSNGPKARAEANYYIMMAECEKKRTMDQLDYKGQAKAKSEAIASTIKTFARQDVQTAITAIDQMHDSTKEWIQDIIRSSVLNI